MSRLPFDECPGRVELNTWNCGDADEIGEVTDDRRGDGMGNEPGRRGDWFNSTEGACACGGRGETPGVGELDIDVEGRRVGIGLA